MLRNYGNSSIFFVLIKERIAYHKSFKINMWPHIITLPDSVISRVGKFASVGFEVISWKILIKLAQFCSYLDPVNNEEKNK